MIKKYQVELQVNGNVIVTFPFVVTAVLDTALGGQAGKSNPAGSVNVCIGGVVVIAAAEFDCWGYQY
jgi:hypothetical protein